MSGRAGLLVVLLIAAPSSGCFSYTRVGVTDVAPGEEVRVQLSADGLDRIVAQPGLEPLRLGSSIVGDVVAMDDEQLVVAVAVPVSQSAFRESIRIHQRLSIPFAHLARIEARRLDRWKTGLVAAGVGGAIALLVLPYLRGEFGGTTTANP